MSPLEGPRIGLGLLCTARGGSRCIITVGGLHSCTVGVQTEGSQARLLWKQHRRGCQLQITLYVGGRSTSISDNGLLSPKALWVSVLASTHTDALIRLLKVLPNVVEDVEWIAGYIQLEHFVAE